MSPVKKKISLALMCMVAVPLGASPRQFIAKVLHAGGGSCSGGVAWSAVQACHDAAADGDTITVSAGSYTVSTTVTFTKYVKLVASGTVTLTDNTTNVGDMLLITESTAGSVRVEGFTILQGTGVHSNPNGVFRVVSAVGGKPTLITNNSYASGTSGDFMIMQTNKGVIWSNSETGHFAGGQCLNNSSFVRHKWSGAGGAGAWAAVSTFGALDTSGENNLYIEDNTTTWVAEAIDIDDNARTVVRYNTITNGGIIEHGIDTSSFGSRQAEVYDNTFIRDASTTSAEGGCNENQNSGAFISQHGGGPTFIIGNVIPTINDTWGPKDSVSFFIEELGRASGSYACYKAGYPAPRQPGWGWITGATQAGATGVFQDLERIYIVNNTGTGNYSAPGVQDYAPADAPCVPADLVSTYFQVNREYFLENGSFSGATGIGVGARGSRPGNCTIGVAYWSTDQGGNWDTTHGGANDGTLDKCTGTNSWTDAYYTPKTYPNTLRP